MFSSKGGISSLSSSSKSGELIFGEILFFWEDKLGFGESCGIGDGTVGFGETLIFWEDMLGFGERCGIEDDTVGFGDICCVLDGFELCFGDR